MQSQVLSTSRLKLGMNLLQPSHSSSRVQFLLNPQSPVARPNLTASAAEPSVAAVVIRQSIRIQKRLCWMILAKESSLHNRGL